MKKPDRYVFKKFLMSLQPEQLLEYLAEYELKFKTKVSSNIMRLRQAETQMKLESLIHEVKCPYCESKSYIKHGKLNELQRYICKECNHTFTLTTNTFLEGTNWTWEVWVKMLQMTMLTMSLDEMINVLEKDHGLKGIDRKTVSLGRHKLIHAMSLMPTPTLSGVIQVDETFFRESQKGTRTDKGKKLINVIPNQLSVRLPRKGYSPSRMGVLSPEYACVVCAVDNKNRAVSVVTSMGRADPRMFTDCFDEHFSDITYLCSDGSPLYTDYCGLKDIPHYVRPSSFLKELKSRGYITGIKASYCADNDELKEVYQTNKKIISQLYHQGILDYIASHQDLTFSEFCEIKYKHGLNLSRVNAFHNYLKEHLQRETRGIATRYLPMYVGAYTFMYNWRHTHNTQLSSLVDAEQILVELIKNKSSFTLKDERELDFFVAPKPTGRYLQLLDKKTREMRRLTDNKFFKFDEEDRVISFDQRKFLKETTYGQLQPFGKKYKIKGYTSMSHWQLYSAIMKLPKKDIGDIVCELIAKNKTYSIYEEDIKYIVAHDIPEDELTYSKGTDYVDLERLFIIDYGKVVDLDREHDNEEQDDFDEDEIPF